MLQKQFVSCTGKTKSNKEKLFFSFGDYLTSTTHSVQCFLFCSKLEASDLFPVLMCCKMSLVDRVIVLLLWLIKHLNCEQSLVKISTVIIILRCLYLNFNSPFAIVTDMKFIPWLILFVSFFLVFPQLYFHMLRQRRKVLHGEVIVEKDD